MQKRPMPRDPNQRAKMTLDMTLHEAGPAPRVKDPAAVELGRRGGLVGGRVRAASMTPEERAESARKAARARWGTPS